MTILKLYSDHLQALQHHAENTYPAECCGLLLGQRSGEVKTLIEVLPT